MKRFHSRVDSPVPRQLLIPCESLSTGRMRAPEWPLARVDPHVASQLPVVAEPGATLAAPELLRPGSSLVELQLVGEVLCGKSARQPHQLAELLQAGGGGEGEGRRGGGGEGKRAWRSWKLPLSLL